MHTGTADVDDDCSMLQGYLARKNGDEPEFGFCEHKKARCWGNAIHQVFPDLERFELELEAHEKKTLQLATVVECAKMWKFLQDDGYESHWDRNETLTHRWKGPMNHYVRCPWMHQGVTTSDESTHKPEHTAWAGPRDSICFNGGISLVVRRPVCRREKVHREPTS